jgi:hypothetical protein
LGFGVLGLTSQGLREAAFGVGRFVAEEEPPEFRVLVSGFGFQVVAVEEEGRAGKMEKVLPRS